MLVIDSLSTATNKNGGRVRTESGKPVMCRSQRRTANRILAVSIATAAMFAPPTANATPLFADAHVKGMSTVTRFVPPPPPPPPPAPKFFAPTQAVLTSVFGERWGTMHSGIDLAAPIGTPIVAVTDGTVIEAGPASGFGQWVRVSQADGTTAVFGHVSQFFVTAGQQVKAGEVIALVGNEGQSTGPHLHYEVWLADGTKIDPVPWLAALGIFVGAIQA